MNDGVWPNSYLEYILASKYGKCGDVDTSGNVFVDFKYNSFEEALADSKFAEALDSVLNKSDSDSHSDNKEQSTSIKQSVNYGWTGKGYVLVFEKDLGGSSSETRSKEIFENVKFLVVNNLVAVCKNKKWGVVDTNGKYIVKPQFDDIKEFSEGMCAIKQNGKWGFMNKNFKVLIKPQFDKVENFSEGYAAVAKSNLWGYINPSGKFVIKPQYAQTGSFFAQMASVSAKDYVGLIDTKGSFIVKFSAKNSQYSFVDSETYRFRFSPDYMIDSTDYQVYKYILNFPKFGYVVIDKNQTKSDLS